MRRPSVDDMFTGKQSCYSLVIGVAKRAREITENLNKEGVIYTEKPVKMAIEDFKEHRYGILEPEVDD